MSQEIIQRHIDFWNRDGEVPLISKLPTARWYPKPYPLSGNRLATDPVLVSPDDIDVNALMGAGISEQDIFTDDLVNPIMPKYPTAWLEAVIGCPIYVSAYGCVAKQDNTSLVDAVNRISVKTAMESPWMKVMDNVLDRAKYISNHEAPVPQLHFRGVIDLLAASLSESSLCLEVYDHSEEIDRLANILSDIWIVAANRGLERRDKWNDGYVSLWGVYAPGPIADYQIDASSLFSVKQYMECFTKWDRKVLSEFPYSVTHLHACGLYMIDAILDITEMRALQVQLDRETGVWNKQDVFEYCRRIQDSGKCLIVHGELSEDELEEFGSVLSPKGLAIRYWNP